MLKLIGIRYLLGHCPIECRGGATQSQHSLPQLPIRSHYAEFLAISTTLIGKHPCSPDEDRIEGCAVHATSSIADSWLL